MHTLQFKVKKDRVSLDVTGSVLTLGFKCGNFVINMNRQGSLDIINNQIALSYDDQTLSFEGLGVENVFVSSSPVTEQKRVIKQKPNHVRYQFSADRVHPLTSKVLLACSKETLTRDQIFQKILDKDTYAQFTYMDKYRRSYDYYRPLIWTLEKAGLLSCNFEGGRQVRSHKFSTTEKGKKFLLKKV
jgi:hypothetical protein